VAVLVIGPGIGNTRMRRAIERRDAAIDLPRLASLVDPVDIAPYRRSRYAEPLLQLAHRGEGAIPQEFDDLTLTAGVAQPFPPECRFFDGILKQLIQRLLDCKP